MERRGASREVKQERGPEATIRLKAHRGSVTGHPHLPCGHPLPSDGRGASSGAAGRPLREGRRTGQEAPREHSRSGWGSGT